MVQTRSQSRSRSRSRSRIQAARLASESPAARKETTIPFESLLPGGTRDLSWIALQAFGLGIILASCVLTSTYFLYIESTWWRLPTFFVALSIFHFLEFWDTAYWNVPAANAGSFLLFNNGRAYTIAHFMATIEILVSLVFPKYGATLRFGSMTYLGIALVVVGQLIRSIAMAQAGTNFNHLIQHERKDSHILVTDGIYRYLRHPSYFGFFWWALGTQCLVGNKVCLVGYAIVLWKFFARRIRTEEMYLGQFFGAKYAEYKQRTGTKIPFIP